MTFTRITFSFVFLVFSLCWTRHQSPQWATLAITQTYLRIQPHVVSNSQLSLCLSCCAFWCKAQIFYVLWFLEDTRRKKKKKSSVASPHIYISVNLDASLCLLLIILCGLSSSRSPRRTGGRHLVMPRPVQSSPLFTHNLYQTFC